MTAKDKQTLSWILLPFFPFIVLVEIFSRKTSPLVTFKNVWSDFKLTGG